MENRKCKTINNVEFDPKYMAYITVNFKKNKTWNIIDENEENITISRDGIEIQMDKREFNELFKEVE